mmetsp:Transcript_16550/g.35758  ORF Transcript_16550/g.35758 Transcript_16550/m.35758 type:complete len:2289 (+) Transcript_16550:224-7090(+)
MDTTTTTTAPPSNATTPQQEKERLENMMPNNGESSQNDDTQSNDKTEVISNKMTDVKEQSTTLAASCQTCGSTKDCEEDVDNPGDYFCKSCWEEYDVVLSQHSQPPPGNGNDNIQARTEVAAFNLNNNNDPLNNNDDDDDDNTSSSTSQFMTPRGLSLGTQAESSEASFTAQTQPFTANSNTQSSLSSSQAPTLLQTQGLSGASLSLSALQEQEVTQGVMQEEIQQELPLKPLQCSVDNAAKEKKGDDYSNADMKMSKDNTVVDENAMADSLEGGNDGSGSMSGIAVNKNGKDANQKNDNEDSSAMDDITNEIIDAGTGDYLDNPIEKKHGTIDKDGLDDEAKGIVADDTFESLPGVKKNGEVEEEPDAQPDIAEGVMVIGGDESRSDAVNQSINQNEKEGQEGDATEKKMEIDETIEKNVSDDSVNQSDASSEEEDDEEEDAWMNTQEDIGDSKGNGMGGAFGLLTQAADDDDSSTDGEEDNDNISLKKADNEDGRKITNNGEVSFAENISKTLESKAILAADQSPMIEDVTTATESQQKGMSLSGLTEPTQPENMLPREKLPSFSTVDNGGAPPSQGAESPQIATATLQPLENRHDCATLLQSNAGDNGKNNGGTFADDGSSAYRGLTEEDEIIMDVSAADGGVPSQKSGPIPSMENEEQPSGSSPNATMNIEGKCDKSQQVDQLEGIASEGENEMAIDGDNALKPTEDDEAMDPPSQQGQPLEEKTSSSFAPPEAKAQDHDQSQDQLKIGPAAEADVGGMQMLANDEAALEPSTTQNGQSSPLENMACNENDNDGSHVDAEMEDGEEHVEGTGDTIVTTGSASDGWSLYEGDTQMLPTGPSQIIAADTCTISAVDSSPLEKSGLDVENAEQMNLEGGTTGIEASEVKKKQGVPTAGSLSDEKEGSVNESETIEKDAAASIEENINLLVKPTGEEAEDTTACEVVVGGNDEFIIEEKRVYDPHNVNLLAMKQTPENGSLPISYPKDHHLDLSASPKKKASCGMPPVDDAPQCDKMEEEDGDETQLSQDLLALSPAKPKRNDLPEEPSKHEQAVSTLNAGDPTAQPDGVAQGISSPKKPSPTCNDHDYTVQKKSEGMKEDNIDANALEKGNILAKEQATPKSPPRQKNSIEQTKWMSSARHLHVNQKEANSNCSSPRLLMPSFKPIRSPTKPTLSNDGAEDGSDNESWPGRGHNFNDSDSIENTQEDEHEVKRPSTFKRLSRGTSRSSAHDDASSKISPQSNEKTAKTSGGSGAKRAIKPKVLRYEAVTKSDDASSTSAASDSSSEAEFSDSDDVNNDNVHHLQQSQTDQQIMKQLREVKAMASNLPSAEEIRDIASRKQLADEMVELKKLHKTSINKLKREKSKLVAQLNNAEEVIKQKDYVIKDKNSLLKEQFEVIAQFTGTVANGKSSSATKRTPPVKTKSKKKKKAKKLPQSDSDSEEERDEVPLSALKNAHTSTTTVADGKSSSATKRTSPATTKSKKRKKTEKPPESDSDSEEENDELPLSALKNAQASTTSKKRRKSYGSRQNKSPAKKVERALSPKVVVSHGSGDASSIETSHSTFTVKSKNGKVLSPELWRELQDKGWKYQTGPEPHNKVYVPKDGATHVGTQLGIHFFDCDQVIAAAIERGDLVDATCTVEPVQPGTSDLQTKKKSSEPIRSGHTILRSDAPMDDSRLCGSLKLLTLESAQAFINIVAKFMCEDDDRFIGSFFNPMWNRLKDQGADSGLNWRYDPYRNTLSSRYWCFVPPSSTLGVKGVVGKDYFLTEEQVAFCVLKEVSTMKEASHLLADHAESLSVLLPVLTRAVDENMEYKDAKLGKSSSVRTRRAKSTYQPGGQDSPHKPSPQSGPKGKSPQKIGGKQSSSKKRLPKITPESKAGSSTTKKQKTMQQLEEHTSPSFHMSQTQGVEAPPSYNRRSPGKNDGPLSGFSFFYSGIDPNFLIDEKIKRLGGKIVPHTSITVQSANRKAFFIADSTSWRKMKYIYAVSLGAPMLHYQWITELEKKYQEFGTAKAFDSELYIKYRLPLGLDLSKNHYPLQRASNARSWDPPGCTKGEGNTIFHGMTIALAIDQTQESDWKMILVACGATVKTLSDIQKGKGKITVDCCLFASTSLPPHVVSRPVYVSKMMQFIGNDVPLVDLAWAHQSIIQRKRLPLVEDARYSVSLDHMMNSTCNVFSIKNKAGIRYEVGDLVQFSRGPKTTARGRIVGIIWERQGKCKMEIQLLDSNGGFKLVDCPSSAKIVVDEGSLQGNVLMLGAKDFHKLGYLPKNSGQTNIFNRCVPKNESQM